MATNFLPNWIFNDLPFKTDTGILVTSWSGHKKWLKYTLNSYKQTGKYVLFAYDSHLKPDNILTLDNHLPPIDVLAIPHATVLKHATWDADKRNGWLWNILYGGSILLNFDFKYIFTINSDCALDRPEGMEELIELLGDDDYMSQSLEYEDSTKSKVKLIHTCSVLYKRDVFEKLYNFLKSNLKINRPDSYSPETLFVEFQNKFNFKLKETPEVPRFPDFITDFAGQIDHYGSYNEDSTWKKIIGFRNLCAENDTSGIERLPPLPSKYFDLRNNGSLLSGYERDSLYHYYKTGDWRYVWMLWDQDEDSWYDRRVYPVEHYGSFPIFKKNPKE